MAAVLTLDCVIDFYCDGTVIYVIELNPFNRFTSASLFDWKRDAALLSGAAGKPPTRVTGHLTRFDTLPADAPLRAPLSRISFPTLRAPHTYTQDSKCAFRFVGQLTEVLRAPTLETELGGELDVDALSMINDFLHSTWRMRNVGERGAGAGLPHVLRFFSLILVSTSFYADSPDPIERINSNLRYVFRDRLTRHLFVED